jgi:hypothetical protein
VRSPLLLKPAISKIASQSSCTHATETEKERGRERKREREREREKEIEREREREKERMDESCKHATKPY